MQKCRFITPSQDAGITVLSMGVCYTHSSALGFAKKKKKKKKLFLIKHDRWKTNFLFSKNIIF
jgi:hypothetical protein